MNDYSIERAAERIFDSRTRTYFDEVYGCYVAGHYRSAVVMLWSVVVTDILFKLDYLKNAYSDPKAISILLSIDKLQKEKPTSAEWEAKLVSDVASQTDLLDNAELTLLQALQAQRHLSAHPVLTEYEALFSPNKETARAHIRNILDSVLTKPPIMSRKVFDDFIKDVENFGRLNLDIDGLKKILEARYFKYFSLATHIHVFRSFWRVTFKSADPRSKANRRFNRQILEIMFSNRKTKTLSEIDDKRDWFSDVSFDDDHLVEITAFFRSNPEVYPLMADTLKVTIASYAKLNINNFALCWFISDSLDDYIQTISQRVSDGESLDEDIYLDFCQSLQTTDCFLQVLNFGILSYGKSKSFNTADLRFKMMIRPFLDKYKENHIILLMEEIEKNDQTYGRICALEDHQEIKKRLDKIYSSFDLMNFPNFKKSITRDDVINKLMYEMKD